MQLLSSQRLRVFTGKVPNPSLEADYDTSSSSVDFITILLFLTIGVFFNSWKPFTSSCWYGQTFKLWSPAFSVPATNLEQWRMEMNYVINLWTFQDAGDQRRWTNCWARSWLLKTTRRSTILISWEGTIDNWHPLTRVVRNKWIFFFPFFGPQMGLSMNILTLTEQWLGIYLGSFYLFCFSDTGIILVKNTFVSLWVFWFLQHLIILCCVNMISWR